MRVDYVQQHAGNTAVYEKGNAHIYAHWYLEKFNVFTSESTKKQEKRGKWLAVYQKTMANDKKTRKIWRF
jgi:hypothetical protein